VTADRFWWRLRHKERASFAPWLSGHILSKHPGSTVVIELHSPMTRKVRIVIGAVVILLGLLWFAATPNPSALNFVVAAAAILALVLFPLLGTRLYADEQRLLREAFEDAFAQQIERD
jgi:protein-S-isoprenylcysteine O-methyltransferase Ste14